MKFSWIFRRNRRIAFLILTGILGFFPIESFFAQTVDDVTGQSQISSPNEKTTNFDDAKKEFKSLTVERIYGSGEFSAKGVDVNWSKIGRRYAKLVPTSDDCGGTDIVWEDPISQETTVLVRASELIPNRADDSDEGIQAENQEKRPPISIESYAFSPDGTQFLIFANSRKVWRTRSRGDFWILDKKTNVFRKLGGSDAKEATLQFAKLSPNGRHVAYVRENNLYVEEIQSGKILPLTTDGDSNIINGTFDWVYEEEFQIQDGFRWSPDGGAIVFWRLDSTNEPTFTMIDNVSEFYPKTFSFKYPRVGCENATVAVGIVEVPQNDFADVATNPTAKFVEFDDPNEFYIPWLDWKTSRGPMIQKTPRAQNRSDLLVVDPKTMKTESILTETDPAWVSIYSPIWLADGDEFLWISERDGFRRIYRTSVSDPKTFVPVTPEGIDIIEFVSFDYDRSAESTTNVDEAFKTADSANAVDAADATDASACLDVAPLRENGVYFYAAPKNATERFLYRVDLDGKNFAKIDGIAGLENGFHSWSLSANAELAIWRRSAFGVPATTELVRLDREKATSLQTLEDNAALKTKLASENLGKTGFMSFDIQDEETGDVVSIDGYFILPPNWNADDPNQKFPLLIYVYGEPAGQTVQNAWGGSTYLFHQMLAQRGCVVVSFDNRGTPVPKGRAWRKAIYRKIGALGRRDQAAVLQKFLKESPIGTRILENRIGVWGWSAGGTSTLNLMFNYPELYRVGIAVAPVPDFRYYDTIYQERYTGLLGDSAESYENGSPYSFAQNLQGKLLLVHGTGDDNCHYQSFERLVDKLIKEGKSFDLMSYAFRSHGIFEGAGTTLHLRNLMLRFWETNLLTP